MKIIEDYFAKEVFADSREIDVLSPNNWGNLLKSLRNKIAHKNVIRVSNKSDETIIDDILLDFPTLNDLIYDRFCQAMQNGMFWLFQKLFPLIYDLEWKAGPYREGMWEDE